MALITNLSREAVTLPTGHIIAREDEMKTTNAVLRSADNSRTIGALVASGVLAVEYDPDEPTVEAETSIVPVPAETPTEPSPAVSPLTPTPWASVPAIEPTNERV